MNQQLMAMQGGVPMQPETFDIGTRLNARKEALQKQLDDIETAIRLLDESPEVKKVLIALGKIGFQGF